MGVKTKDQLPKQGELFTPMSFVTVDPRFDDTLVSEAGRFIDEAKSMQRFGMIHPDTVFERADTLVGAGDGQYQEWSLCGVSVVTTPKRLRSFRENPRCVECGCVGNVFLIERHTNDRCTQYLNFYSAGPGGLTLMTVDHILPDSWYGRYDPVNFQTMCRKCNQQKQHVMSVAEIELIRADIKKYAKAWVIPEFLDELLQLQLRIHETGSPALKLALNQIKERYRKRVKHTTKRPEVLRIIVDLQRDVAEAVASQGAVSCPSLNVVPVEAQGSTKGSWSERMKRWFASLVVGVVTGNPDLYRSLAARRAQE